MYLILAWVYLLHVPSNSLFLISLSVQFVWCSFPFSHLWKKISQYCISWSNRLICILGKVEILSNLQWKHGYIVNAVYMICVTTWRVAKIILVWLNLVPIVYFCYLYNIIRGTLNQDRIACRWSWVVYLDLLGFVQDILSWKYIRSCWINFRLNYSIYSWKSSVSWI